MEAFLVIVFLVIVGLLVATFNSDATVKKTEHCKTHKWEYRYTPQEVYLGHFCSVCEFKAGTE